MDTELAEVEEISGEIVSAVKGSAVPVLASQYDDSFGDLASSVQFLPRVMLLQSSSEPCKTGDSPPGHYGLVEGKDKLTKLGSAVDVVIVNWRPKALDTSDRENILEINDPADPLFRQIQEKAGEKDSGCMFGPEFLVWVAQTQQFATLFCGSKTARREAPQIKVLIGKPATLKVQYIKGAKFSWHGMVVTKCSTPFELPDDGEALAMQQAFLNPPKRAAREEVEAEAGASRER